LPIEEALASINPVVGDYIKSQAVSATYFDEFGWFGEMTHLEPLKGYMLKTSHTESLIFPGCETEGTFIDERDAHEYKWVKIGAQTWMAENLAWLPSVSPPSEGTDTESYFYVYDYEAADVSAAKTTNYYTSFGALYNYPAALTACPDGWHLPSDEEWKTMEIYLGMSSLDAERIAWRQSGEVGVKLKSKFDWYNNANGDNSSDFNALPGGYRSNNGSFEYLSEYAAFWSSTPDESYAWLRYLYYGNSGVLRSYGYRRGGLSVRCLQD
jgi:uncharacterized protein (TIGR02145 family)